MSAPLSAQRARPEMRNATRLAHWRCHCSQRLYLAARGDAPRLHETLGDSQIKKGILDAAFSRSCPMAGAFDVNSPVRAAPQFALKRTPARSRPPTQKMRDLP